MEIRLKSRSYVVERDGKKYRFPTLADYVSALKSEGVIEDETELRESPEYVSSIFNHWLRCTQVGCLFASRLVLSAPWPSYALTSTTDLAEQLTIFLDHDSVTAEASQFIFPLARSHEDLIEIVNELCAHASWSWQDVTTETVANEHVLVGLRWNTSNGASWVLGFGDFPEFPITRRAPFTALVLRPRGLGATASEQDREENRIHLAQMQTPYGEEFDVLWKKTEAWRLKLLGRDDPRAKARVTFSLPASCQDTLVEPT